MRLSKGLMLLGRAGLLGVVLSSLSSGAWGSATINGIVWLVTLVIPYLGREDERFHYVDFILMLAFTLMHLTWGIPALYATMSTPLGIDKLYHAMGGFALAWGTLILAEKHSWPRPVLTALTVVVVIGVGWEIFEYALGQLPEPFYHEFSSWSDSAWDLVADLLGAAVWKISR